MQRQLGPAEDARDGRDVVRTKRWILHHDRYGLPERDPIHVEAVGVERMFGDLLRHPNEERVVNVKGLI